MQKWQMFQAGIERQLEGDLAEFGVFEGNVTKQLAMFQRPVWAFDTFEGIPAEDYIEKIDSSNPPGKWKPRKSLASLVEEWPNIIPVKGRFEVTLPTISADVKFAVVHIDCDYYESYRQVLDWLPQHLTNPATIVTDDYYDCEGAKIAIEKWVAKHVQDVEFDRNNQLIIWNPK